MTDLQAQYRRLKPEIDQAIQLRPHRHHDRQGQRHLDQLGQALQGQRRQQRGKAQGIGQIPARHPEQAAGPPGAQGGLQGLGRRSALRFSAQSAASACCTSASSYLF